MDKASLDCVSTVGASGRFLNTTVNKFCVERKETDLNLGMMSRAIGRRTVLRLPFPDKFHKFLLCNIFYTLHSLTADSSATEIHINKAQRRLDCSTAAQASEIVAFSC